MSSDTNHLYTPLQTEEIRLLRRLHNRSLADARPDVTSSINKSQLPQNDTEEQPPQYALEIVTLNAEPEFKALSYTWGTSDLTHEIVVDGVVVPISPLHGFAAPSM